MPQITLTCASDRSYCFRPSAIGNSMSPYSGDTGYMVCEQWVHYITYETWILKVRKVRNGDDNFSGTGINPAVSPIGALLSFEIPDSLKNKKIDSAVLNYTMGWAKAENYLNEPDTGGAFVHHLAYADSRLAESISLTDFDGSKIVETGLSDYDYHSSTSAVAVSFNITSLIKNNIYDGVVNILERVLGESEPSSTYRRLIASRETGTPPTLTITYSGYPPEVKPVMPVNEYVKKGDSVTFAWEFNSPSSAKQTSWVVYTSTDGEEYTISGVGMDESTSFTYSGDLGAGTIYWKVAVSDEDGQQKVSDVATFTVMAPPEAPVITEFSNTCLPTLKWNAVGQASYEVVIESASGDIVEKTSFASTEKQYTVKNVLDDGTYSVKVRIMNAYEMWSGWASRQYTISTTAPTAPTFGVEIDGTHLAFSSNEEGELWLYRKRNGKNVLITKFSGTYNYYGAPSGEAVQYFVRKIDTGYADSSIITKTLTITGIVLFCDGVELNLKLSKEQFMPFTCSTNRDEAFISYAGRELPVRESGDIVTRSISRSFVCDDYAALEKMKLSDSPIQYRDSEGHTMNCAISSILSATKYMNRGYAITCTFTEVEA